MQIVVLDGRTTNPGDISWEPLKELGKLTVYDDTPYELIRERAGAAEAVIMNRTIMDRAILKELPCLRFLGALATGYNTIDIAAAEELGITVCNVPLYCAETVAQHAFSLLLALCNRAEYYSETVRDGGWKRARAQRKDIGNIRVRRHRQRCGQIGISLRHEGAALQPYPEGSPRRLQLGLSQGAVSEKRRSLHPLPVNRRNKRPYQQLPAFSDEAFRLSAQHFPRRRCGRSGSGRSLEYRTAGRRRNGRPFSGAARPGTSAAFR